MLLTKRLIRYGFISGGEVWVNALTGAVDKLSRQEVRLVDKALVSGKQWPRLLFAELRRRGYLYTDQREESGAFNQLVQTQLHTSNRDNSLKHLIVCPTYACNLRCIYCFERRSGAAGPAETMTVQTAEALLAAFSEIRKSQPQDRYMFGLFGGEPMMPANRKIITRVFEEAENTDLKVFIVTNGVGVREFLPLLDSHRSMVEGVQVTIDGPEEIHDRRRMTAKGRGSYRAVAATTDRLLQSGIPTVLRVNIDRSNVQYLPALTQIIKERGWHNNELFKCSLAPVKDHTGKGEVPNVTPEGELLASLFDVYDIDSESEKMFGIKGIQSLGPFANLMDGGSKMTGPRIYNCEANNGDFCVGGPDGYLYACPEAIGQPDLAIGRFEPELELWQDKVDQWINRNISSLDQCHECEIAPLCGGGCTYAALARYGDSARPVCDVDIRGAIEVFLERRVLIKAS